MNIILPVYRSRGVVVFADEKWPRVFVYHKIQLIRCSMYQSWRPYNEDIRKSNWVPVNNYQVVIVDWHHRAAQNFADTLMCPQHQLENWKRYSQTFS